MATKKTGRATSRRLKTPVKGMWEGMQLPEPAGKKCRAAKTKSGKKANQEGPEKAISESLP